MIEVNFIAETQEDNQVLYQTNFKYNLYTEQEIAIVFLELKKLECKLMAMSNSIKPIARTKSGDEKEKP
jgi:hypothetical protein